MTTEEIDRMFDRLPKEMNISMFDSYIERLDYVTMKYQIREKGYYFVVSDQKAPNSPKENADLERRLADFTTPESRRVALERLNEHVRLVEQHLMTTAKLGSFRLEQEHLINLFYGCYNFPFGQYHKISPNNTFY